MAAIAMPDVDRRTLERIRDRLTPLTAMDLSDLDLIVAGHSHHPSIVEVEPGRFYVNAGDWIEHHTYVVIRADSAPALNRWPSREVVSRG